MSSDSHLINLSGDMSDAEFETAKLGIEAEHFISSPLGQYLVAMAQRDAREAVEEMKTVNPADMETVRSIQTKLNTPDRFIKWLSELIEEGRACAFKIEQEEY